MNPVNKTAEILVYKVLNHNIDISWVEWAVEMLVVGFETEHLLILAGESEPFNQFEMQDLTNKVLFELQLDYSDKEMIIRNYATYLISTSLKGELDSYKVLEILQDICIELDYEKYLYDFYLLYNAKYDLLDSDFQWYWEGATLENIDKIIFEHFKNWVNNPIN